MTIGILFQPAKIENNEVLDFVEYVDSFYNPVTGVFPIKGATVEAITKAIKTYIKNVYKPVEGLGVDTWGGGDSVDRERVRDIIIKNGGVVIE
jgi:hypothetical protein